MEGILYGKIISMPTSQFDAKQIEQMRIMREAGFTFRVIAYKFGIDHSTVQFHLGLLKKSPTHYKTLKDTPKKKSPEQHYHRPAPKGTKGLSYEEIRKKQNFTPVYDKEGNLIQRIPRPPIKKIKHLWGPEEL